MSLRLIVAALTLCACGAGPYEKQTLLARSASRVDCPVDQAQAQELDGHYTIDVCGYRFAYHCYVDTSNLYRLGDRTCDDTPSPVEMADHSQLTARRVVAADGACPVAALRAIWLGTAGDKRNLLRVDGCGRTARLTCRTDAVQLGDCTRLSFEEESRLDAEAAAGASFAAKHACPAEGLRSLSWNVLEPPAAPPVWSLVLEGCGTRAGYLCRRVDPGRDERADCREVEIDTARALAAARAAYTRELGCAPARADALRAGIDGWPRREVWAAVSGCKDEVLYQCRFADLLAAEPHCAKLDAVHHPAFTAAIDAAEGSSDRHCERTVTAEGRRGAAWAFDVRRCDDVAPFVCRYDAVADRAGCAPDEDTRRARAQVVVALAGAFARETACPQREVRVAPARPFHTAGGWAYHVQGCSVSRDLVCDAGGRCGPPKPVKEAPRNATEAWDRF